MFIKKKKKKKNPRRFLNKRANQGPRKKRKKRKEISIAMSPNSSKTRKIIPQKRSVVLELGKKCHTHAHAYQGIRSSLH